jgi:glycosyltransferase involved in cell wall biosynthesis
VYNAIDERFLHGHATEADRELIAQRYLVNHPFILYAGAIRPHKNVVRIIEAFSALKSELQKEQQFPDLKLIIIGDDLSSHPRLRRTVVRSGVQNDVRFLGFVPIEVLRIFYDVAKFLYFRRSTRDLDCRHSKRWPTELRWSLRTLRACRKLRGTRRCW